MSFGKSMPCQEALPADAERQSYVRIFEDEYDRVYRTLRRLGLARADAEELAQEVFMVLWRRRHEVDAERSLRSWLLAVAYHLATKYRARRYRECAVVSEEFRDSAKLPDEKLVAARDRQLARQAIAKLPEHHRAVLVLHELEEIPVRTLATWWDVPLFTVYTRIRTARQAFALAVEQLVASSGSNAPSPAAIDAILAEERRPEAAPESVKRRTRRRLAALLMFPDSWPGATDDAPALGSASPQTGKLAAIVPAVALVAAIVTFRLMAGQPSIPANMTAASLAARQETNVSGSVRAPNSAERSRTRSPSRPPEFQASESRRESGRPSTSLARGLLGYWSFDPMAPTEDASGNGFDCRLRRPEGGDGWSADRDGGAARFAGPGWLECPQPAVAPASPVETTVAVWVNPNDLRQNHRAVVARAMEGGEGELFFLGFAGNDLILRSAPWRAKIVWPFPGTTGHWVHLAFTHDAQGTSRLFVDGVEVGRVHGPPAAHGPVQTPLVVGAGVKRKGARGNWPASQFAGGVDQLAVYERALGAEEIAWLAEGIPPSTPAEPAPPGEHQN